MHKSRANRKANTRRVIEAHYKNHPLSQEEIDRRTVANKKAKLDRYPESPKYSYNGEAVTQPLCYQGWMY